MFADLDRGIILWLNQFARMSELFDGALVLLERSMLMKGGALVALLWWAWASTHRRLISEDFFGPKTMVGTVLMVAVARALQNLPPERARPIHEPGLDFRPFHFQQIDQLVGWSSFPSDHAVLFA